MSFFQNTGPVSLWNDFAQFRTNNHPQIRIFPSKQNNEFRSVTNAPPATYTQTNIYTEIAEFSLYLYSEVNLTDLKP